MPWELGPRAELVELVETGRLRPGRAIDLGCGTGANAVFLARHGFEVTGVDFAPAALAKARAMAGAAGVRVRFVEDDLTGFRHDLGHFDVLVDYGTLDDLSAAKRDRYVRSVVPLAGPGARFLLWCFEWRPRRADRWLRFDPMAPGEVAARFGTAFDVERIAGSARERWRLIPGTAAYLMARKGGRS
jgi:cyclopropane fatty-acyl-phospholipid synthase-like methyltransferase